MRKKSIVIFVLLILAFNSYAQISIKYPNDKGIEKDPNVLFVENFDDDLRSVISRYDNVHNSEGMVLEKDIPPGSKDGFSLKMTRDRKSVV